MRDTVAAFTTAGLSLKHVPNVLSHLRIASHTCSHWGCFLQKFQVMVH